MPLIQVPAGCVTEGASDSEQHQLSHQEPTHHARPAETAGGVDVDVERAPQTERTCTEVDDTSTPGPAADSQAGDVLYQLLTPGERRSRRKREVRARTVSVKRMTKRELELGRLLHPTPDDAEPRPSVRGECEGGARPCPYVSCKHHLYLDVHAQTGAIKMNFPDLEVDEMALSCSLDGADEGGMTLEKVGEVMNLTRERIRQVEVKALDRGLREIIARAPDLAAVYGCTNGEHPRASTLPENVKDATRASRIARGLCGHCGKVPHREGRRTCAPCGRQATAAAIRSRDRRRELVAGKGST